GLRRAAQSILRILRETWRRMAARARRQHQPLLVHLARPAAPRAIVPDRHTRAANHRTVRLRSRRKKQFEIHQRHPAIDDAADLAITAPRVEASRASLGMRVGIKPNRADRLAG